MTPDERFEAQIVEADDDIAALAHVADHIGMGDMSTLFDVKVEQVRAHWATLPVAIKLSHLLDLEGCPW